jgi:hypothetical protein
MFLKKTNDVVETLQTEISMMIMLLKRNKRSRLSSAKRGDDDDDHHDHDVDHAAQNKQSTSMKHCRRR